MTKSNLQMLRKITKRLSSCLCDALMVKKRLGSLAEMFYPSELKTSMLQNLRSVFACLRDTVLFL